MKILKFVYMKYFWNFLYVHFTSIKNNKINIRKNNKDFKGVKNIKDIKMLKKICINIIFNA